MWNSRPFDDKGPNPFGMGTEEEKIETLSADSSKCPTCGASFDATRTKNCPHCGNVCDIADSSDWAITGMEVKKDIGDNRKDLTSWRGSLKIYKVGNF